MPAPAHVIIVRQRYNIFSRQFLIKKLRRKNFSRLPVNRQADRHGFCVILPIIDVAIPDSKEFLRKKSPPA